MQPNNLDWDRAITDLVDATRTTVIPAEPGWKVLHPVKDEAGDKVVDFYPQPVLAWRVDLVEYMEPRRGEFFTTVEPVTVEGLRGSLERPDGRVVLPEEADFENREEALDYLNREKVPA